MPYYTHINRGVIDANRKNGTREPPITIKRGRNGKPQRAFEVALPAGARMVYSPDEPILSCGARLGIVSDTAPTVIR